MRSFGEVAAFAMSYGIAVDTGSFGARIMSTRKARGLRS